MQGIRSSQSLQLYNAPAAGLTFPTSFGFEFGENYLGSGGFVESEQKRTGGFFNRSARSHL
jgi:hypothetical protein